MTEATPHMMSKTDTEVITLEDEQAFQESALYNQMMTNLAVRKEQIQHVHSKILRENRKAEADKAKRRKTAKAKRKHKQNIRRKKK